MEKKHKEREEEEQEDEGGGIEAVWWQCHRKENHHLKESQLGEDHDPDAVPVSETCQHTHTHTHTQIDSL